MPPTGLLVPLLTTLRADRSLDLDALSGHVEWLLAAGVEGLVALGTTGEFADLTAAERAAVVHAAVAAAGGRAPVLAGVGAVGTAEACEHARAAADAGADGLLALPPLYWKLADGGLVRHFGAIASATGLPVLLYDFPALSGTPLSPALVERVSTEVPAVSGIKLSGPELRVVHGVVARVKPLREDFTVLVGSADLVLPALLAGADGAIVALANFAPEVFARLFAAFRAGELAAARAEHALVLRALAVPALGSPPILALKAAAHARGSPVRPVVRTEPDDPDRVRREAVELAERLPG